MIITDDITVEFDHVKIVAGERLVIVERSSGEPIAYATSKHGARRLAAEWDAHISSAIAKVWR